MLKASEAVAATNHRRLKDAGVLAVNLMSAPGSGKTALLESTLARLKPTATCSVLVGDLQTTRDAERLGPHASDTIQINTGAGCHLTPTQVAECLDRLALDSLDYLFIENVGNMVCPAAFDLGEQVRVALLSLPEGDDKVAKYPTLFQQADAILLTKIDLMPVMQFSLDRVRGDLSHINTAAPLMLVSSRTGEGMDQWLDWLRKRRDPRQ